MENLTHLLIIWVAVLVASFSATRLKLTPVLLFLFFGSLITNVGLQPMQPTPFISGLAEIGIVLIMCALGFEESTSRLVNSIKRSWGIAFSAGLSRSLWPTV